VRNWRKAKNKLTELPSDMEEALTAWIEELRGSHARVRSN